MNWTELNWHNRYGMVWLQFIVHHRVIRSMRLGATCNSPAASIQVQVALGTTSSRREIRTEQPGKSALLQRSQVRLQDASSRSQTFITGDFEPSKFKWNQIERAQDILRCLIRLISFDFVWFRLILKIRLNLPVCFLPFTRLDPLFETFWARTWRPRPNRPMGQWANGMAKKWRRHLRKSPADRAWRGPEKDSHRFVHDSMLSMPWKWQSSSRTPLLLLGKANSW